MLPRPDGAREIREIRVSDGDRDRYVAVLRSNCADGRLTLDEFSDRVGLVYEATARHELDAIVADLALPWTQPPPQPVSRSSSRRTAVRDRVRSTRWHLAICGQTIRRGRFRLAEDAAAVAICGECTIDLTDAIVEESATVDAVAICGQVTIIVPPGLAVAVDGLAIAGEKRFDDDDEALAPIPGAPTISVRALAVCGAVRVRRRASRRLPAG